MDGNGCGDRRVICRELRRAIPGRRVAVVIPALSPLALALLAAAVIVGVVTLVRCFLKVPGSR